MYVLPATATTNFYARISEVFKPKRAKFTVYSLYHDLPDADLQYEFIWTFYNSYCYLPLKNVKKDLYFIVKVEVVSIL